MNSLKDTASKTFGNKIIAAADVDAYLNDLEDQLKSIGLATSFMSLGSQTMISLGNYAFRARGTSLSSQKLTILSDQLFVEKGGIYKRNAIEIETALNQVGIVAGVLSFKDCDESLCFESRSAFTGEWETGPEFVQERLVQWILENSKQEVVNHLLPPEQRKKIASAQLKPRQ